MIHLLFLQLPLFKFSGLTSPGDDVSIFYILDLLQDNKTEPQNRTPKAC